MSQSPKSPILKADKKIEEGDISVALKYVSIVLRQKPFNGEAAGQYLFCLNTLGMFDKALAAARNLTESLCKNETVLSNILCAMLSVSGKKASEGLKLLKKLNLAAAENWKSMFSSFNYNPAQTGLAFNAAMVFAEAGRPEEGEKLIRSVCEHIVFFINNNGGKGLVNPEQTGILEEFTLLIKESGSPNIESEAGWQELTQIISDNHSDGKRKKQNRHNTKQ